MAKVHGGDKARKVLDSTISKMHPGYVEVGFPGGAYYPAADGGQPVALIAAFNEYGVPSHNQPPRPFFRNMIKKNKKKWPGMMAKLMKYTNGDTRKVLALMGQELSGELTDSIDATNSPKLAQSTIDRKGFSKPLIETGLMKNSVRYVVKS